MFLLNDSGLATHYTRCLDPVAHALATYYRFSERVLVCDACNESPEWIAANLWRYPVAKHQVLITLLNLTTYNAIPEPLREALEPLQEVEPIIECPDIQEVSSASQDVVECCASCTTQKGVTYVGMDGEMLCKRCWQLILVMSSR